MLPCHPSAIRWRFCAGLLADGHGIASPFNLLAIARSPRPSRYSAKIRANNRCRRIVDCKYPQPVAFRGLPGVGMRAAVDHLVAVGRATALVATFVDDLSVHRGAHASLNMLALGLAHSAENAHQHLVRRITVLELAAQRRRPTARRRTPALVLRP